MARLKFRLATALATLFVLAAVLWPSEDIPDVSVVGLDKAVHVFLFGLWALALRFDWLPFRERPALLVAAAAVFGPFTEALQLFAPGRSFDLLDMAADLAGAALAAALGAPLLRLAERLRAAGGPPRR